MARQIQMRRGTAIEHQTFTGAPGEVTVDTTNKILRLHDGQTPGGIPLAKQSAVAEIAACDYVVQTQFPTQSNGFSWYRKYKSGWVEQGGFTTVDSGSVNLLIKMANTGYCIQFCCTGSSSSAVYEACVYERTQTSFKISRSDAASGTLWMVVGPMATN